MVYKYLVLFVTGLGTDKHYYGELSRNIKTLYESKRIGEMDPSDIAIKYYYFDKSTSPDNAANLYETITQYQKLYDKIITCAFSISCHASLHAYSLLYQSGTLGQDNLILIDPLNINALTSTIKMVISAPSIFLFAWDRLPMFLKYYILKSTSKDTPALVDKNLAQMSAFHIRHQLKQYIYPNNQLFAFKKDIEPKVLVGVNSKYTCDYSMWNDVDFILGNHHIIYNNPEYVAQSIIKHVYTSTNWFPGQKMKIV